MAFTKKPKKLTASCSFHPGKPATRSIRWPGQEHLVSLLCNDCVGYVASQSRKLMLTTTPVHV